LTPTSSSSSRRRTTTGRTRQSAWLVDRLKSGGFTNARKAADWRETDPRPGGGVCDCKALHAKVTETTRYEGSKRLVTYALRWSNACIVPAHRQAKERASEQKRLAKEATAGRVQQHVKRTAAGWAIPEGRAIAIDRILAEAALWGLLSYRIPTWAEAHGGKKNEPVRGDPRAERRGRSRRSWPIVLGDRQTTSGTRPATTSTGRRSRLELGSRRRVSSSTSRPRLR
jgi:hypothetical protein